MRRVAGAPGPNLFTIGSEVLADQRALACIDRLKQPCFQFSIHLTGFLAL